MEGAESGVDLAVARVAQHQPVGRVVHREGIGQGLDRILQPHARLLGLDARGVGSGLLLDMLCHVDAHRHHAAFAGGPFVRTHPAAIEHLHRARLLPTSALGEPACQPRVELALAHLQPAASVVGAHQRLEAQALRDQVGQLRVHLAQPGVPQHQPILRVEQLEAGGQRFDRVLQPLARQLGLALRHLQGLLAQHMLGHVDAEAQHAAIGQPGLADLAPAPARHLPELRLAVGLPVDLQAPGQPLVFAAERLGHGAVRQRPLQHVFEPAARTDGVGEAGVQPPEVAVGHHQTAVRPPQHHAVGQGVDQRLLPCSRLARRRQRGVGTAQQQHDVAAQRQYEGQRRRVRQRPPRTPIAVRPHQEGGQYQQRHEQRRRHPPPGTQHELRTGWGMLADVH
jgi:hypothetical protein